jgi:hypothetical protein
VAAPHNTSCGGTLAFFATFGWRRSKAWHRLLTTEIAGLTQAIAHANMASHHE